MDVPFDDANDEQRPPEHTKYAPGERKPKVTRCEANDTLHRTKLYPCCHPSDSVEKMYLIVIVSRFLDAPVVLYRLEESKKAREEVQGLKDDEEYESQAVEEQLQLPLREFDANDAKCC